VTDDNQVNHDQPNNTGELLIYQDGNGDTIRVLLEGETVWLTQAQMAELYQTTSQNVTQHLRAIYAEGELDEVATCKHYLQVRREGERSISRRLKHYRLEAILAVGYRVRSLRGTQFRRWATARLSEYLVKGFTLDDERLKGNVSSVDYFDELLARIRDIRTSEARVYQRIRDIFALASDYSEDGRYTQRFFATVQNKMHFAATGLTAAEIVRQRADAERQNMGLTSWKGGQVAKRDVATAKNYLGDQEIDTLNRITVMFLDQAEFRAMRRQGVCMADWDIFLDAFLVNTELPVLGSAGRVSHEHARNWAEQQYDTFTERRRVEAEKQAGARYLDDLRSSAKELGTQRKPSARRSTTSRRGAKRKKEDG